MALQCVSSFNSCFVLFPSTGMSPETSLINLLHMLTTPEPPSSESHTHLPYTPACHTHPPQSETQTNTQVSRPPDQGCSHEEEPSSLYGFPRAAPTQSQRLSALTNRNLLSLSSGGQKLEIKVSAGLVPSGGSKGETIPYLSLSFWNPWRSLPHRRITPISASIFTPPSLSMCVPFSSYKDIRR